MNMRINRMQKELQILQNPPQGIQAYPKDEKDITELEAVIRGASNTPYEDGLFKLEITIPERYPIEPPNVRFITPIYHPNIDDRGRICLDILNMPPKGAWKPSLNISTVLTSLLSLMSEPNPDDGLMSAITEQYRNSRSQFDKTAREYTKKYAMLDLTTSTTSSLIESASDKNTHAEVNSSSESESDSSDDEQEDDKEQHSKQKTIHTSVALTNVVDSNHVRDDKKHQNTSPQQNNKASGKLVLNIKRKRSSLEDNDDKSSGDNTDMSLDIRKKREATETFETSNKGPKKKIKL